MLDFGVASATKTQLLAFLGLVVAPAVLASQEPLVHRARIVTPSSACDAASTVDFVGSYRKARTGSSGIHACHLLTGVYSAPAPLTKGRKIALSAVAGFAVGAVVGGTIAYRRTRDCDGPCAFNTYFVVGASVAGGVAGALVGGSIGALVFREQKTRIDR